MKLKHLIIEISAADKAKQMGLVSMGFGKFGKNGNVTHRIEGDKLLPVKGDDATKNPTANAPKPTGMSAKTAGTTPSNTVTPKDVTKSQEKGYGDLAAKEPKEEPEAGKGQEQGPPVAPHNPHRPSRLSIGRPVEPTAIPKLVDQKDWRSKEYIIGEEVVICDSAEFENFRYATTPDTDYHSQVMLGEEAAEEQNSSWRNALDIKTQERLLHVQVTWQSRSQYHSPDRDRTIINSFINDVAKGPPPAELVMQHPIERGMVLDDKSADEFLQAFRIGEDVEIPPSGFSTNPRVARFFSRMEHPEVNPRLGVVIRLAPNREGKVHGISLTKIRPDIPELRQKMGGVKDYEEEDEVIRPAGPKARCVGVTKLVSQEHDFSQNVCYIIDLEEQGYPQLTESSHGFDTKKKPNKTFIRLMNTPLSQIPLADSPITEGKASDQAHKLGLQHHGGPYWSKSGKVVAMTVDDNLVKVTLTQAAYAEKVAKHLDKGEHAKTQSWKSPNINFTDVSSEPYEPDQDAISEPTDDDYAEMQKTYNNVMATVPKQSLEWNGEGIMHQQLKTNQETGGTNPGGIFKGMDGKLRYLKFYTDGNKSQCEALANSMYDDLGILTPKSGYFKLNGSFGFYSEMLPTPNPTLAQVIKTDGEVPKDVAAKFLKGFAADCLVANWDALGIDNTNVRIAHNGDVFRVDNGGSFLHRATAGRKDEDKLNKLTEIGYFITQNPTYSVMFKTLGITHLEQMAGSFKQQVADILKLHNAVGGWDKYVTEKVPDMDPTDKAKIVKMLYERTRIMVEKVKKMDGDNNG